jgi:hypothetical protein
MKQFLDRITRQFQGNGKDSSNSSMDKVAEDVINHPRIPFKARKAKQHVQSEVRNPRMLEKSQTQRQNSRHMDFTNAEDVHVIDSDASADEINSKKRNLGRLLWSIPNDNTKIAVQSMINAGIQASILSALEHFKELQDQQANFLQQHKV